MDRGIPTEETLGEMRAQGVDYLVGTPKGKLAAIHKKLLRSALGRRAPGGGGEIVAEE